MNDTITELPAHWKPDPRWPDIVIQMARNCAVGIDDRGPLADWFEEQGMEFTSQWVKQDVEEPLGIRNVYAKGVVIGIILGDGYGGNDPDKIFRNYITGEVDSVGLELIQYLASRTL